MPIPDYDESDEPVGFEQDPDSEDIGDGYFVYQDGRREYGSDPETAQKLDAAGKANLTPSAQQSDDSYTESMSETPAPEAPAPKPAPQPEVSSGMTEAPAAPAPAPPAPTAPVNTEESASQGGIQIPASSRIAASHNNPGNLKYAGQAGAERGEPAGDGGYFARFSSPQAGYDAIGKQVELDKKRGGTLADFITKYAPPGSNDTGQYIEQASKALGAKPDAKLADLDTGKLQAFIAKKESSTNTGYQNWEDKRIRQERQQLQRDQMLPAEEQASNQQSQQNQQSQAAQTSESVQRTGSAQPLEEFQAGQEQLGDVYQQAINQAREGSQQQGLHQAMRASVMMDEARAREAAATAAIAQRDQRANFVKQKISDVSSRPTDNNKIWKDKGTFGTLMGFLGVAMGSAYATKHGGPNTALQTIAEQRQQAIKSQLDDRDSELRGLERELGSLDAAVPMLEARMNKSLEDKIQAQLQDEKSQDTLKNGKDLIAKLQIERASKLQEAAKAYHGTIAQSQATNLNQSTSVGTTNTQGLTEQRVNPAAQGKQGDPLDHALKLRKDLVDQGYSEDQADAVLKAKGLPVLPQRQGQTDDERKAATDAQKRDADQGKTQAALDSMQQLATARGLVKGQDGKWHKGGKRGSDEEVKAAQEQGQAALESLGGGFEDNAKSTVGGGMHIGHELARTFIPFWGDFNPDAVGDEELAAKLNAAETAIRPRATPTDRTVSAKAGEIRGKKIGNMREQGAR
jgi:hypothetical protein